MIHILITGFAALVLGLNLMMIMFSLSLTTPNTPETIANLIKRGTRACIAGLVVIVIGIVLFIQLSQPEGVAILTAGANVLVLGIVYIVQARGQGNEKAIRAGAWFSAGFGVGLILTYCLVVHIFPLINTLRITN